MAVKFDKLLGKVRDSDRADIDSLAANYVPKKASTGLVNSSIFVDDSGNVGIGTTSPNYPLSLVGAINPRFEVADSGSSSRRAMQVGLNTSLSRGFFQAYDYANSKFLPVYMGGAIYFGGTDDNYKNGIGTTSPSAKLHIKGTGDYKQLVVQSYVNQSSNIFEIQDSSGNPLAYFDKSGRITIGGPSNLLNGDAPAFDFKASAPLTGDSPNYTGAMYLALDGPGNNAFNAANYTRVQSSGSGNYNQVFGVLNNIVHAGSGTLTNVYSHNMGMFVTGGGNVSVWHGDHIRSPVVSSGSLGTAVGIYVEDIASGSDNYAIYTNAGKVRFGDDAYFTKSVAIGTTDIHAKLSISHDNDTHGVYVSSYANNIGRMGINQQLRRYIQTDGSYYSRGLSFIAEKAVASGVTDNGYINGFWGQAFAGGGAGTHEGSLKAIYGGVVYAGIYGSDNTGSVNTVYGLEDIVYANSGSIDTAYTLYIGTSYGSGSIHTLYGVYQADSKADNYFAGDVTVAGSFSNPSDVRLKEDITRIQNSLDTVMKLNPVRFKWNETAVKIGIGNGPGYGLIAQEVENVIPDVVTEIKVESGDTYKTVDYVRLVPLLIGAIKELADRVNKLEGDLNGSA